MGYEVIPLKKKCYKCGEPMAKWVYDSDDSYSEGFTELECSNRCYHWFDYGMESYKPKKVTVYSALRTIFKPVKK